jgi:3-oxoacyl-[acyl-carrier protein] reductase
MSYPHARYALEGCVALVTGGNGGIGAAIAGRLAASGASVVVWDRTASDRGPHLQQAVDVTRAAAVDAAMQDLIGRFGKVDFLVNSAGYSGATLPLEAYAPEEWQQIVDVNLMSVYQACRAAVPSMRAAGRGRIVNIASLAGKEGTANFSAYSAAKAGVIALTKSLGKELAQSGVLVNAIAPAAVRTPLLDQMSPEHVRTMVGKSPMGRLGEADEVAELALWLCSGSCSFSTGAVFDLSGGRATY